MKKFKTKEIVALIIIGILMIATVVGGGFFIVNNVKEANSKLEQTNATVSEDFTLETKTSETQIEGKEVTVAKDEKTTEETKATEKESEKKTETQESTKKKTDKDKTQNNTKATENKTDNKEDVIEVVVPETNATHSSKQILKVNGVDCYVGDTISVTLNIKTPDVLMNFQGYTKYDDKYLKLVSVEKNVGGSTMVNDHKSCIYYNGSDIMKGYDFTGKGTLYTATFKVLKKGNTGIVNEIEVLSDMDQKIVNPKDAIINIGIFS